MWDSLVHYLLLPLLPVAFIAFIIHQIRHIFANRRVPKSVAFFHPYCNAGGGGERVLWAAVRSVRAEHPDLTCYIYSGDTNATKESILWKAHTFFGIELDGKKLEVVFLKSRRVVEPQLYPVLTLLLQTLAGGVLAFEALWKLTPEIMVDSMGYPMSTFVFKLFGATKTGAYIHYPTISTDMIDVVARRQAAFNNANTSTVFSNLKLVYYYLFAAFYRFLGLFVDVIMVNGTWTKGHITSIWHRQDVELVFPPVNTDKLRAWENNAEELFNDEINIVSVGQIRPEKNHRLQIAALKQFLDGLDRERYPQKIRLSITGGCRNQDDQDRVDALKKYAEELGVTKSVDWQLNVKSDELERLLQNSLINLHTMRNEHFGIAVVEGLASGSIMVAHNSGGPAMDIVVPEGEVGFLADTCEEYVARMNEILALDGEVRDNIRRKARVHVNKFSEAQFDDSWSAAFAKLV
ncbi:unnamed protein product, partial [Mesorhabditis spiculigera]